MASMSCNVREGVLRSVTGAEHTQTTGSVAPKRGVFFGFLLGSRVARTLYKTPQRGGRRRARVVSGVQVPGVSLPEQQGGVCERKNDTLEATMPYPTFSHLSAPSASAGAHISRVSNDAARHDSSCAAGDGVLRSVAGAEHTKNKRFRRPEARRFLWLPFGKPGSAHAIQDPATRGKAAGPTCSGCSSTRRSPRLNNEDAPLNEKNKISEATMPVPTFSHLSAPSASAGAHISRVSNDAARHDSSCAAGDGVLRSAVGAEHTDHYRPVAPNAAFPMATCSRVARPLYKTRFAGKAAGRGNGRCSSTRREQSLNKTSHAPLNELHYTEATMPYPHFSHPHTHADVACPSDVRTVRVTRKLYKTRVAGKAAGLPWFRCSTARRAHVLSTLRRFSTLVAGVTV